LLKSPKGCDGIVVFTLRAPQNTEQRKRGKIIRCVNSEIPREEPPTLKNRSQVESRTAEREPKNVKIGYSSGRIRIFFRSSRAHVSSKITRPGEGALESIHLLAQRYHIIQAKPIQSNNRKEGDIFTGVHV
jgi:hypothetical protein